MRPAPLAALLDNDSPAPGRAFVVPAGGWRVRPTRRRERARSVYMRAVPEGSSRAASQVAFLTAVREAPALAGLRADRWATVWAIAQQLAFSASWETMTSRPTWSLLSERSGRSRSTVARTLALLRAAGLVGIVATGRSAGYQPAARDAGQAEAAVYVLCTPSPLSAVDEDDTPTGASPVSETHPPHAHASNGSSEPLRGPQSGAPAAPAAPVERDDVPGRVTDTPQEPRRPDWRLAQADELRNRVPVLRRISTRHVAAIVREFALAGWSTTELVNALDRRPDGTGWAHDGAAGVGNVGAWATYRLAAWRSCGVVLPSPAQLEAAAAVERRARQRAEREAAAVFAPVEREQSPALAAIRAHLAGIPRRTR